MDYSKQEIKLFKELGFDRFLNIKYWQTHPVQLYEMIQRELFIKGTNGPAVDAVRRAVDAILNGDPYRLTPEFDKLIEW